MITLRLSSGCSHSQHNLQRGWGEFVFHATRRTRHKARAHKGNNSTYAGRPDVEQDLVGSLLDSCLSSSSRVTQSVISKAADILQSIAPEGASRQKIEVSVKGALFLLLLGLLKGVINFVLLAGTVGLAVYVASQVFGWNAVVLGQQQQGTARSAQPQQQYQQHYSGSGHATAAAAAAGGNQAYSWDHSQQKWQQQQQQPRQVPWDAWQQQHQEDVVDVFYGKPPSRPQ